MEWLIIIGLGVALYKLWRRIEQLEQRFSAQETLTDALAARPAPKAGFAPEPERPVAKVTGVAPPSTPQPIEPQPITPTPAKPEPARSVARIVGDRLRPATERREEAIGRGFSVNFEELFGRQLPIWAGGITLAIAGFFLVVYAIDLGLLSPFVRVLLGFAFGAALLNGAFLAERMKDRIADPRVPQALAGAGLATLYACFYLAGSGYDLIGGSLAFLGLAGVTAAAVWLSYRFGLPCAVLGLVGGFAAPLLVTSTDANLPLLSIYLALVSGGLALTGNRQQRPWLGLTALLGGLVWGSFLTLSGELGLADQLFVGIYLVAIGAVLPAFVVATAHGRWWRMGAGAFAALQMAVLIDQGDYSLLSWGLYGLLAGALAVLGWRNRDVREASVLATAIAALLLAFWPDPAAAHYALVGFLLALVLAVVPCVHVMRGTASRADVVQLAGAAPAFALAAFWHFGNLFSAFDPALAVAAFALAAMPGAAAWRIGAVADWRTWLIEVSTAATVVLGLSALASMEWGATVCAVAAIAAALAMPQRVAAARTLAAAAAGFGLFVLTRWLDSGVDALWGTPFLAGYTAGWSDTFRYFVPGVVAGLVIAWRQWGVGDRRVTAAIATLSGAGALVAVHTAYKSIFAIGSSAAFVSLGMAERTVWEALLLGVAVLAWLLRERAGPARNIAMVAATAALAHFTWFTLLVHNPLWSSQAVGPVPVANLLTASFATAIAAIAVLRSLADRAVRERFHIAIMILLPILAVGLLRQMFSGSILIATQMGQGEDLLRSLAGIVLAIGYLAWGAKSESRTWRIGSLVLMLLAVGKVFLADAAVLDGLARIASFLALGFSLIGIGWFYSRILGRPQSVPPQTR